MVQHFYRRSFWFGRAECNYAIKCSRNGRVENRRTAENHNDFKKHHQDSADRPGEGELPVKEKRQRETDQELENQAADRKDKRIGDRFEEDFVMEQLHIVFETDKMLLAAQEVHDVDILEPEDDIMHNRVADESKHVNNRGQREEKADVVMPEKRFYPAQNDSPFPSFMIVLWEPGSKRKN